MDVALVPAAAGRRFFRGLLSTLSIDSGPEEVIVLGSLSPLLAQADGTGGLAGLFLPLLLMGGIFYFLLIRPQQRRTRAQRDLIESLDVGDEVITVGGIFGTIRALDEEAVTLEVSPGIEVRLVKSAIARKLVFDEDAYEEEEEGAEEEEAGEQK
jgi:preprotein translocase subunit YajC